MSNKNVGIENLAHAAKEINELLELDDANKILDDVGKFNAAKANEVKEELLEASGELSKGDEVSKITAGVLKDLGSTAKFSVKEEKKAAPAKKSSKKYAKAESKKKFGKKKPAAKKPAAKAKAKPAKAKSSSDKGKGWREGSSADIIHQLVIKAGKKGITKEQLIKKAEGKFETTNLEGKVKTMLGAMVGRELAEKNSKDAYIAA